MKKFFCDAAVVIGLAAFDYGLALAWRPLGFMAAGLELAALAFLAGYGLTGFRKKEHR